MRIFIVTLGTRGDFEPFWALGQALQKRGHYVTIGASAFHLQDDPTIEWVRLGQGTQQEFVNILRSLCDEPDHEQRNLACVQQWVLPQLEAARLTIATIASKCDYFISNIRLPLFRGGKIIPGALVSYDPPATVGRAGELHGQQHGGALLELVAMPRSLVDPQHEWDRGYQFTGFWSLPDRPAPRPASLQQFLHRGAHPAVLTMGSMVTFDPSCLSECFENALEIANLRGVQVTGWSGLPTQPNLSERLYTVDEVDYSWLFSQASCVAHHGGAGTVASVLRSGAPSILLPQIPSQTKWGDILTRCGLCAGVLSTHDLDPFELASVLRMTVDDAQLQKRAHDWDDAAGEGFGLPTAADLIEQHMIDLRIEGPFSTVPPQCESNNPS